MDPNHYPTPINARVFIEGWWLDDVFSIEFNEADPKIPVYNYHGRRPAFFAQGKGLTSGTLYLNFRFPNYLYVAIKKAMDINEIKLTEDRLQIDRQENARIDQTIRDMHSMSPEERARFLAIAPPDTFKEASGILQSAYSTNSIDDAGFRTQEMNNASALYVPYGFDLWINYGDATAPNAHWDKVLGVQLVGRGKQVSSGPTDSGRSILEAYPFVAREILVGVDPVYRQNAFRAQQDAAALSQL